MSNLLQQGQHVIQAFLYCWVFSHCTLHLLPTPKSLQVFTGIFGPQPIWHKTNCQPSNTLQSFRELYKEPFQQG